MKNIFRNWWQDWKLKNLVMTKGSLLWKWWCTVIDCIIAGNKAVRGIFNILQCRAPGFDRVKNAVEGMRNCWRIAENSKARGLKVMKTILKSTTLMVYLLASRQKNVSMRGGDYWECSEHCCIFLWIWSAMRQTKSQDWLWIGLMYTKSMRQFKEKVRINWYWLVTLLVRNKNDYYSRRGGCRIKAAAGILKSRIWEDLGCKRYLDLFL